MLRLMGKQRIRDEEVLAFASKLSLRYKGRGSLMKAFEEAAKGNAHLERVASRLRLSCSAHDAAEGRPENRNLDELLMIVESGLRKGYNIRRALELFRSRLESEMRQRERFRAKTGSPMALTYMGMCVFFPLFTGISSVILTSAVGGSGSIGALANGFVLVSMLYPPIILYLSSAFAHPDRPALQNLLAVAPYLTLASAITLITRNYLSGML